MNSISQYIVLFLFFEAYSEDILYLKNGKMMNGELKEYARPNIIFLSTKIEALELISGTSKLSIDVDSIQKIDRVNIGTLTSSQIKTLISKSRRQWNGALIGFGVGLLLTGVPWIIQLPKYGSDDFYVYGGLTAIAIYSVSFGTIGFLWNRFRYKNYINNQFKKLK